MADDKKEIMTLDEKYAISVIRKFLTSWKELQPTDIEMGRITGGALNTVYWVKRKDGQGDPHSVILRCYGGTGNPRIGDENVPDYVKLMNTESQEVLICHEQGKLGNGPKLYGIFDGGRIEELLLGRTLTDTDLADPEMDKSVAEAYAKMHSLRLPLADKRDEFFDIMKPFPKISEDFKNEMVEKGIDITFLDMDINSLKEWVRSELDKTQSRIVLNQFDTNFLNVFVRNSPTDDQAKVVLIDFELSFYTYRAIDLGGHFVNRTIIWDNKTEKRRGNEFPTLDERRRFLQSYLAATNSLGYLDDFEEMGRDSVVQLLKESILGSMANCLHYSNLIGQHMELAKFEGGFTVLVSFLMSMFKKLHQEYEQLNV